MRGPLLHVYAVNPSKSIKVIMNISGVQVDAPFPRNPGDNDLDNYYTEILSPAEVMPAFAGRGCVPI